MGLRIVELFAGVGGFRLGLEEVGSVIWSNQWEPTTKRQHASECYIKWFGVEGHTNVDIASVEVDDIPAHDFLVGGFPCQDYSVATTKAEGIHGKKGVLWWEIERILRYHRPPFVLLENVDRLIRSPRTQKGRDFAVLLRCLTHLGYRVEWRVINAADYGFPQRRRRTFLFAAQRDTMWGRFMKGHCAHPAYLPRRGFFGREFGVQEPPVLLVENLKPNVVMPASLQQVSDEFQFHFGKAGIAVDNSIWTQDVAPQPEPLVTLRSILDAEVDEQYYVPDSKVAQWKYLKGAKAERRETADGFIYHYSEGPMTFPDSIDDPSRTLMTGEGGTSPSRFNHIVEDPKTGRLRVLTPTEAERLNGFRAGWTKGLPERRRYFCMGNALVVGLVRRMGKVLNESRTKPLSSLPPKLVQ